ncbi:IS3 family transposase, partial [Arcticibacter eurypsychrophilus]|uniref:IS3 family transposase n=1 Tax=Arcticibacter eurypsychrophilus TaxID=1434752 RepID=UPI000A91457C
MKCSLPERRMMVSKSGTLSITDQCGMLGIHRSGFYYVPEGESALNLVLMQFIDAYFLKHPHTGVVTLCAYLCMSEGFTINVKRVRRLMRLMGLMAIYPSKKLSIPDQGHTLYPYLLRGLQIERVNQVW